jgi:hypothetical protein
MAGAEPYKHSRLQWIERAFRLPNGPRRGTKRAIAQAARRHHEAKQRYLVDPSSEQAEKIIRTGLWLDHLEGRPWADADQLRRAGIRI